MVFFILFSFNKLDLLHGNAFGDPALQKELRGLIATHNEIKYGVKSTVKTRASAFI